MGYRTTKTTQRARDVFLAELAKGLSVTAAALAAAVNRQTMYAIRQEDPDFAAAWDDAIEAGTDLLEDEARRRAYEGYPKPLVSAGRVLGEYTEYSDTLMTLLLKGRRPSKFKDRHEVTGPNNGPQQHEHTFSRAALDAAEDAYLSALGGQPGDLVGREGDDHPSDAGPDRV